MAEMTKESTIGLQISMQIMTDTIQPTKVMALSMLSQKTVHSGTILMVMDTGITRPLLTSPMLVQPSSAPQTKTGLVAPMLTATVGPMLATGHLKMTNSGWMLITMDTEIIITLTSTNINSTSINRETLSPMMIHSGTIQTATDMGTITTTSLGTHTGPVFGQVCCSLLQINPMLSHLNEHNTLTAMEIGWATIPTATVLTGAPIRGVTQFTTVSAA